MYAHDVNVFGPTGLFRAACEKDTTILDTTCEKLTCKEYWPPAFGTLPDSSTRESTRTFERSDTVFFYSADQQYFYPAYFWNAQVGDTLPYYNPYDMGTAPDTLIREVVDSAGARIINGQTLRYCSVRLIVPDLNFRWLEYLRMIERIGATDNELIPYFIARADSECYPLRCCRDSTLGRFSFGTRVSCGKIRIANDPMLAEATASISPSPARGELCAQCLGQTEIASVHLVGVHGRVIITAQKATTISVATLAPALYFVHVQLTNGETAVLKVVKEQWGTSKGISSRPCLLLVWQPYPEAICGSPRPAPARGQARRA